MHWVGIYARPDRVEALEAAKEAYRRLSLQGVKASIDISLKNVLTPSDYYEFFDLRLEVPEALIVIGGDGTLLRALSIIGERLVPLLHLIKVGRRAFYFELSVDEGLERIKDFIEGRYYTETLMRLRVLLNDIPVGAVLNDAVIISTGSKTIDLRVFVDEELIYEFEGDGLIISTPAGSSAYSLSAGGPLVDPELEAIVLTPLNPLHCLKPLVVSASSTLLVELVRVQRPPLLVLDGQKVIRLKKGDTVRVMKSQMYVRIARYGKLRRFRIPRT